MTNTFDDEVQSIRRGDLYILGYIRENRYLHLKTTGLLQNNSEFYYYFHAIKGETVYSHHKDLFKVRFFRFYLNNPDDFKYVIEPVLCRSVSNELVTRTQLTAKLVEEGYITNETDHSADYYYLMKMRVIDTELKREEVENWIIDEQNGNDSFSPGSPKVVYYIGSDTQWQTF